MTSPCPRCGGTKTDPVMHGLMYKIVWAFGYRLQECARCRGPRFLPRHHDEKSHSSSPLGTEPVSAPPFEEERGASRTVEANIEPTATKQISQPDSSDREVPRCPVCGSAEYHRTKRTILERILSRPKVAHCEGCGARFPYPGHRRRSSDSGELGEAVATEPRSAEEKRAPIMAEENGQPKVTKQVAGADSSNRGSRRCPTCTSTKYHHTQRTTLEHLLRRPSMARCEKCGSRFPYPGSAGKYPEPLKVVRPAATVPRPSEERTAPEMAAESSQAKVAQQTKVVDYSDGGTRRCPHCGKSKYHRSKRTTLDRVLLRPGMAHCEVCGGRFPYPAHHHHHKSHDPVKSGEAAATGSHVGEEGRASRASEGSSQAEVAEQGATPDSSNRGSPRCPVCGSPSYRRSRRTTLEKILMRPKMARCRNCRKRFPYPKQ